MSGLDLLLARAELNHRTQVPTREWLTFVREHRINMDEVRAHAGLLELLPLIFDGDRFDFADDGKGELGIVLEALDADGETVLDLVAWPISAPERIATMFGSAAMLGLAAAVNPATFYMDGALRIHRRAIDWLRSGCEGAVIVDTRRAARVLLEVTGRIAAEDTAHAIDLARAMSDLLNLERIVVPLDARKAA